MPPPPLIRALFLGGGGIGGVPLDSHDDKWSVRPNNKLLKRTFPAYQSQRLGILQKSKLGAPKASKQQ